MSQATHPDPSGIPAKSAASRRGSLAILCLFASMCGYTACSAPTPPLRVSIDMWIGFGPWVLGKEKHLFEKRGVNLEPVVITGTGEKNAAMAAHLVEARAEGLDSIVLASNQGVPGKVVLVLDESTGGDGIVARRDIRTIGDLKGKRVGFQPGLPGHFFLLYLLHEAGLAESDLSPQKMDSAAAGSAFFAGQLDAAVTWEPWLSRAAEADNAHLLASTREHRDVIVDVLAVQPDLLRDRPLDVEAVIRGWFDSVEYWKEHRDEANAIVARFFKLPVNEMEAILRGVEFPDLKRNGELFGTARSPGRLNEVGSAAGEIWFNGGVLKRAPKPVATSIDGSIVQKLARSPR